MKKKSLVKTLTFAVLHFLTAFLVVYALTGSWALGGAVALIEPLCNTVVFFFHEKAWERFGHSQEDHCDSYGHNVLARLLRRNG
ncbi:DUF2061 domain-containing protein [Stutzerimonas tarimensis]|uniref:DUF2061 domain-containing protein n=1 Tax=Stutzerimonas tarimensis TaxID=1507735 RepID=A0ABV7T2A8_9GAMM